MNTNALRMLTPDQIDRPLAELELPAALAPLEPFKQRLGVIQKLSHKISGGGDHGKQYGALGCFNWRRGPLGQTIDHAIAAARPSVIPVVGLGLQPSPEAVIVNTVSAASPKRPQPMVCQPDIAFQSLFGSVAEGNVGKTFQARNKLLDWIRKCRPPLKPVRWRKCRLNRGTCHV